MPFGKANARVFLFIETLLPVGRFCQEKKNDFSIFSGFFSVASNGRFFLDMPGRWVFKDNLITGNTMAPVINQVLRGHYVSHSFSI